MYLKGERVYDYDVLVVGSGLAGLRAAIQSKKYGVSVILVEKGLLGRCGETMYAGGAIAHPEAGGDAPPPLTREPTDDAIMRWISSDNWVGRNYYLRDQRQAEIIAVEQDIREDELRDYGVEKPAANRSRSPPFRGGYAFTIPLVNYLKKAKIETLERTMITDLIRIGDSVVGAVGFNLATAQFTVFRAKATILATGGMGEAYERNNVPKGITGDGYAMALRAGAELEDMEFQEWDRFILNEPGLPHYWLMGASEARDTCTLRNGKGEAFFDDYMKRQNLLGAGATLKPEDPWLKRYGEDWFARTDDVSTAMALEVHEGRGDRDSVLLDYSRAPIDESSWQESQADRAGRYLLREFPWKEKPLHVFPGAISTCGGLKANEWCETNLQGLYAAGEVATGGHKLTHSNVFGVRAGTRAAEYSRTVKPPEFSDFVNGWIKGRRNAIEEILARKETPNMDVESVRRRVRGLMWRNVGVLRSREGLEAAIRELRRTRSEDLSKLYARNLRDLRKCLEVINMVDAGEATATVALHRTETRGVHHRLDYPERDDSKWLKNIIVRLEGGELKVTTEPVDFTRFYPPKSYRRRLW
jgi:succinate dehydrogenase/fumarate reductase flavoprotein subunit